MNENLSELLTTLIQVVIIPSIPILVAFLAQLLRAKSNQAKIKLNNDLAKQYLQEATEAVIQAVTYTSQTYVDSLKKQGRFDADAQKIAFNTAKDVALKLLTEEAKQMITDMYGDLTVWLDTKIEQTVKEQKVFTITGLQPIQEIDT